MLTNTRAEPIPILSARPHAAPRVAVLIPCLNEELTIAEVVRQFRTRLPQAAIYVFDNNSSDRTAERARAAGATVFREPQQGKGYVVRAMFREIEADVYLLVDGDGTYPPEILYDLIGPIIAGEADMVVGTRWAGQTDSQCRYLNRAGNLFFRAVLNRMFGVQLTDVLSGYRSFSRNFVKNATLSGSGFEIEIELTIKAIERGYRIVEVPSKLYQRPPGSRSKIKVLRDGFVILWTMLALFLDYKPRRFFCFLVRRSS